MNQKISITVLTATYNRAYKLSVLFNSLVKQSDLDFDWLIIDDGSIDETKSIVSNWQSKNVIRISYFFKRNGGKHTAINLGVSLLTTDLVLIVDSDDILHFDAIYRIKTDWELNLDNQLIGLMYLKSTMNGKVIGQRFRANNEKTTYIKSRLIDKIRGDKAEVWKTSILKKKPFPEFIGEFFLSEQYVYISISALGHVVTLNSVIYSCEYLEDGLSKNIRLLQTKNPNGALLNAMTLSKKEFGFSRRFKSGIQIVTFSLFAKKNPFMSLDECGYKFFKYIYLINGIFLYYIYNTMLYNSKKIEE